MAVPRNTRSTSGVIYYRHGNIVYLQFNLRPTRIAMPKAGSHLLLRCAGGAIIVVTTVLAACAQEPTATPIKSATAEASPSPSPPRSKKKADLKEKKVRYSLVPTVKSAETSPKAKDVQIWDTPGKSLVDEYVYGDRREDRTPSPKAAKAEAASGFPFPPPRPSAFQVIPRELLVAGRPRLLLKDIATELDSAFTACGYGEKTYYGIPDGFAMVSRIEQINEDGTPNSHRWSLEIIPIEKFSLRAYLNALFKGRSGHYRVIAFIATPHSFTPKNVEVTSDQTTEWFFGGSTTLPEEIGNREYSASHACTAFIYEFRRIAGGQPEFVKPSQMTGRTHLENAGLWVALAKPQ
jgi:hypothetical protein